MTGMAMPISTQLSDTQYEHRERRRVVRRPLNLRVEILDRDGLVHSFTGKNIGLGGVFFRADSSLYQLKDIIKPRLYLNYNGSYKPCCIAVQVMHISEDGFGVCFHQYDNRLFRYIYKMMYEPIHHISSISVASTTKQHTDIVSN